MPGPRRRVYGVAAAFYVGLFLFLVWPIYPRFADARPFVLGLPASLAYVVYAVLASFLGLLALFLWEDRRDDGDRHGGGRHEGGDERDAGGRPDAGGHTDGGQRSNESARGAGTS